MRRWCRIVARCRRDEDRGFAMLSVLLLVVIVAGLTTLAVTAAIRNTHGSGLARAKVQAADAAETGIDTAYERLQASSGTGVPCSGDISGTASTGASYTTDITYYSVYPPTDGSTPITCTGTGLASEPVSAIITSTATPSQAYSGAGALGTRKAQSLVKLSVAPSASNGFDQAVFSNGDLYATNTVNIASTTGLNADVYTNGSFLCDSSGNFQGSVITQSTATLSNTCSVNGDVWAKGDITANNGTVSVAGALKSSTGNADLSSKITIGKGVTVAGTCCGGTGGKTDDGKTPPWSPVASGVVGMAAPPSIAMPVVTYNPSDWTGFTVEDWKDLITENAIENNAPTWSPARIGSQTCTGIASGNYSMNGNIKTRSTPTILDALDTCGSTGIQMQSITVYLYADTAIFTDKWLSSNGVTFKSGDGAAHKLWLIVPWTNGSASCTDSGVDQSNSIDINSGMTIDPKLSTLIYTPGGLEQDNYISMTGQVYACESGVLKNELNLTFDSLGVPGVKPAIVPTYNVDVVYQREIG